MTKFTEGRHPGEGLMSEANFHRSRGKAVVALGSGVFKPGAVLGKITLGAAASAAKAGGNTGTGALTLDATTPVLAGAKAGVYQVRCIEASAGGGVFRVSDPDGFNLGDVAVGQTFANDIKFAIADGDPDFALGDGFDVTVDPGSGKYAPSPDALTAGIEGAEVACAIAIYGGDATTEEVEVAIIERDAEWNGNTLSFDASVNSDGKKASKVAQLAAAGIIARY